MSKSYFLQVQKRDKKANWFKMNYKYRYRINKYRNKYRT